MLLCLCTLPIIADTETLPKLLMLDVDVWGASSCDLYLWTAAWHTLRYNMFVHVYVLHGHTFCIDSPHSVLCGQSVRITVSRLLHWLCTLYTLWSVCTYSRVTPSALTLHTLCFVVSPHVLHGHTFCIDSAHSILCGQSACITLSRLLHWLCTLCALWPCVNG